MQANLAKELAALTRLTVGQLRLRYADVFGEPTRTSNKTWLVKRIAWRLQVLAEGALSERACQRAEELAQDADLRLTPPRLAMTAQPTAPENTTPALRLRADTRLPPPGTLLTRVYKGQTLHVKVLAQGFEYSGQIYPSLSAVAKAVTGSHCNGYLFFRIASKEVAS
jgi:hypothetical protein